MNITGYQCLSPDLPCFPGCWLISRKGTDLSSDNEPASILKYFFSWSLH